MAKCFGLYLGTPSPMIKTNQVIPELQSPASRASPAREQVRGRRPAPGRLAHGRLSVSSRHCRPASLLTQVGSSAWVSGLSLHLTRGAES